MIIRQRKNDHIDICNSKDVEFSKKTTLFECIELIHCALPDLTIDDIDISVEFMGKILKAPIIISAMTGGSEETIEMNRVLASVAEKYQIGFGVGSQRAMLDEPELRESYEVREVAPTTLILGNIGICQARELSKAQCRYLMETIEANGLCLHLNPAMELFQAEGDRNFRGGRETIIRFCDELGSRLMIKETGCGISREVGELLFELGVRYMDVSGAGGTSWVKVEAFRNDAFEEPLSRTFSEWGIPTAASLIELSELNINLVASGGIRSGLDIAKAIVLEAKAAGIALPVLKAFKAKSREGVEEVIQNLINELKIVMILTGSKDLKALNEHKPLIHGKLKLWMERYQQP